MGDVLVDAGLLAALGLVGRNVLQRKDEAAAARLAPVDDTSATTTITTTTTTATRRREGCWPAYFQCLRRCEPVKPAAMVLCWRRLP